MKLTQVLITIALVIGIQDAVAQKDFKQKQYRPNADNFEAFINEAYGDKAERVVFNQEIRRVILKDALNHRIRIFENPERVPERFPDLSQVELVPYKSNLSRSTNITAENFNPFKYKLDFNNTKEKLIYHIDGTLFYFTIAPLDIENINELRKQN